MRYHQAPCWISHALSTTPFGLTIDNSSDNFKENFKRTYFNNTDMSQKNLDLSVEMHLRETQRGVKSLKKDFQK